MMEDLQSSNNDKHTGFYCFIPTSVAWVKQTTAAIPQIEVSISFD
jgi:hypothetical protein